VHPGVEHQQVRRDADAALGFGHLREREPGRGGGSPFQKLPPTRFHGALSSVNVHNDGLRQNVRAVQRLTMRC
jgi:hypothetical protein